MDSQRGMSQIEILPVGEYPLTIAPSYRSLLEVWKGLSITSGVIYFYVVIWRFTISSWFAQTNLLSYVFHIKDAIEINEPINFTQAWQSKNKIEWLKAMKDEMVSM